MQQSGVLARGGDISLAVDRRRTAWWETNWWVTNWWAAARRAGYLPRGNVLPLAVWGWWLVASAWAIADAITTYVALDDRVGVEANPFFGWLIARIGVMPVLVLRATVFGAGVMGIVALFAACDRRLLRTGAQVILMAGTLFWAAVFVNNALVLTR
ncbi:MAG TPA: DUF5658 family protein [Acidimicrobiia bacterium]